MKQVIQSLREGSVTLVDTPAPQLRPGGILVRTAASLVSPGTERAGLKFSKMSLLAKARSRPDLVSQVVAKARRDGLVGAVSAAFARLEQPQPLGYASAGRVIAVGADATEFASGDRVACAGTGYAGHVEIAYVPKNLAVAIPAASPRELSFDEASFAALGAVALHGVRLGAPQLGDRVVVIGLGLVGLLTGQILRANGCVVIGVEPDAARRALAVDLGFDAAVGPEAAEETVQARTRGIGADLVLVAASSLRSEPVHLAGRVARDRATLVAVGDVALDVPRRTFYRKELSLRVSRSYGPGRYDRNFEERGESYPVGYVRWTERENMRAFLELVAGGRVRVEPLISVRAPIEEAERAYGRLDDPATLGIVFQYPAAPVDPVLEPRAADAHADVVHLGPSAPKATGIVGVSVIGAGTFAQQVLLPILKRADRIQLRGIVSEGGLTARSSGGRHGFQFCASTPEAVWDDADTDAVIVATRNRHHATLVRDAITAGKSVFVEKPVSIDAAELERLVETVRAAGHAGGARVMAGFNRRFAPLVRRVREFMAPVDGPVAINYRVNGGRLPDDSWLLDPSEGGRIVSEVCHFVDTAMFLAGSRVVEATATGGAGPHDDLAATLRCANGSIATIAYFSSGDRSYSKERIEVFGGGRVAVIDDFRRGWLVANGHRTRLGGWLARQRKGHREELDAFLEAVRSGASLAGTFDEAVAATRATFAILESLAGGHAVRVAQ